MSVVAVVAMVQNTQ